MITALAVLTLMAPQADSVRLPTALRAAVSQMIADVKRDPAARAATDVYIDVGSFRMLLPSSDADELAWKQLPLAGGPMALDRSKEAVWRCAPGSADSPTPCLPIPQGKLLVYAVKQTREGSSVRLGMMASWSVYNTLKGQLTGMRTSYEAVLEPSARGWSVKSVKRVLALGQ